MIERAFAVTESPECRCVTVRGEVDMSNARDLGAMMETAAAGGALAVDLTACTYLDSTGLSVFVKHERLHRGRLVIVVPKAHRNLRIFEITGLALTLTIVPSLAEAHAIFANRQLSA